MAIVLDCLGNERPLLTTLLLLRSPPARVDVPFQTHTFADINPCLVLLTYCLDETGCNGTDSERQPASPGGWPGSATVHTGFRVVQTRSPTRL
jgi:hypothetical protein